MNLGAAEAGTRLRAHHHGVLATVHPRRGVDAVPCVYAVSGARLAVPIDRVKPKATGPLGRERNLAADPRATLLLEHWDPVDWSALWWVRAELRHRPDPPPDAPELAAALADAFVQYRHRPFARLLVFDVVAVSGWAAGPAPAGG